MVDRARICRLDFVFSFEVVIYIFEVCVYFSGVEIISFVLRRGCEK